jgi:hypothetical protein
MQTPALKDFLEATGHLVHSLNTVVVGLSFIESGTAVKPVDMDITWSPKDRQVSSRQARSFVVKSSIIFLGEAINGYLTEATLYPSVGRSPEWSTKTRAERIEVMRKHFNQDESVESIGCMLVAHWRNRLIHSASKASLTDQQRSNFLAASDDLAARYKNLDPARVLENFSKGRPTLKDASSLTAMGINWIRSIDQLIPEPNSADDLKQWLTAASLFEHFDTMRRVSAAKGKGDAGMAAFISTHCPHLHNAFERYGEAVA